MMRRPQFQSAAIIRRSIAAACTSSVAPFSSSNAVTHVPAGMYGGMSAAEERAEQSKVRTSQLGAGEFNVQYPGFPAVKPASVVGTEEARSLFTSDKKTVIGQHTDVINPQVTSGGVDCPDGNAAAAHVAYALSDTVFMYPITPSTPMGELSDQFAAAGRLNCFGQVVSITEMQSEGGAAGALHGALKAGAIGTTFTASQGLLLMIPNMYKIAGEFLPCVIHVTARSVATHALSIFGDHNDVMAVRQTGWTMLCSENVQMAHDFAILAHLATLQTRVPILHFFDGFRTSHEMNRTELIDYEKLKALIPTDSVDLHRDLALSPMRPHVQGTSQGPDMYFQAAEAGNAVYANVPKMMDIWAEKIEKVTGRRYAFFAYEGAADATDVVVIMGSGAEVVSISVAHLQKTKGAKVGVLKVRLFRPWSAEMFMDALPATVRRVTVLDRSKDPAAQAEPLFMDVVTSIARSSRSSQIQVFAGRFGLSSREFTPGMVQAVFDNMAKPTPKSPFTVGIRDDVTHLSLPETEEPNMLHDTTQCLFFGIGSDGTVGANKTAIKVLTHNTPLHAQGYFQYDAKKSGGITISHLRISPNPITAPFAITHADYIGIHRSSYLYKYDMLKFLNQGGTVVINTSMAVEALIPRKLKRQLAEKGAKLFVIDANKIATSVGMGKTINMIMQAAFFKARPVLPYAEALELLKKDIRHTYAKKADEVIQRNLNGVDLVEQNLNEFIIPSSWLTLGDDVPAAPAKQGCGVRKQAIGAWAEESRQRTEDYVKNITEVVNALEGTNLPVSAFVPGGRVPTGTSASEKRGIALKIPAVNMSKCTQCNYCSFVCPHAAIRPFLMTPAEAAAAPAEVAESAVPAIGGGALDKYKYRIQVSPMDCTGCELCARVCPSDALSMVKAEKAIPAAMPNWDYLSQLPHRGSEVDPTTVKGSQFQQPLLEFSGACEGCGETAYVKLLTQLVGERLVIANATGCSSIWAGSVPSVPYTTNEYGEGPAWANSLFEDNAEFGLGLRRGYDYRRKLFLKLVDDVLQHKSLEMSSALRSILVQFSSLRHSSKHDMLLGKGRSVYHQLYHHIVPMLEKEQASHPLLQALYKQRDMFSRFSHWIVGGDGWAYDIDFGGLDHVLASEDHVKVMVLDTEMYSNTGGQQSKSTPTAASVKFAESGKAGSKKDLGQYAMTYHNVYVASLCLEANHKQAVRAILEAEAYPGPAILLCYSPCISHGFPIADSIDHCRAAVDTGYWPLYRYNPSLRASGNNPFQLDSKTIRGDLHSFLTKENRFAFIERSEPEHSKELQDKLQGLIRERAGVLQMMDTLSAAGSGSASAASKAGAESQMTILYGSETGNAEEQAKSLAADFKARGVAVELAAMSDFDVARLPTVANLVIVCSTCGLGEFPANSRSLWKHLSDPNLPATLMSKTKYTVFGLGDSHYSQFCAAAAAFDVRLEELGATRVLRRGVGDDQAEEKFFSGWESWLPSLWKSFNAPAEPLQAKKPEPVYTVDIRDGGDVPLVPTDKLVPPVAVSAPRTTARLLTPPTYDRDIRHYEFDISATNLAYKCGDSLAVYPHNNPSVVKKFCDLWGLNPKSELTIVPTTESSRSSVPSQLNVEQLAATVLNLYGSPSRRFYATAAFFASDPAEKAELEGLGSESNKQGQELRKTFAMQKMNFLDVFERYKSCRPPLADLLSLIPSIKPRLYSISSSPIAHPKSIHLTVVEVSWDYANGAKKEERFGLCTNYLKRSPEKANFGIQVQSSAIVLPKDSTTPIIMVGMGTGIAPWRALAQQKAFEKAHGTPIGPVRLYFGARKAATEFLYGDEFKQYEKDGVLALRTAFSRDQAAKIYVQHLLEEDGAVVFDLMARKNGSFYVCGSARQLPADIYEAMRKIVLKHGGDMVRTEADADAMLSTWKLQGRYTVEAYS